MYGKEYIDWKEANSGKDKFLETLDFYKNMYHNPEYSLYTGDFLNGILYGLSIAKQVYETQLRTPEWDTQREGLQQSDSQRAVQTTKPSQKFGGLTAW